MSEELKPVAWRYRYDAPGRKVHWTLTQRPMASQPARPGWCAVIAEPLYLHPPAAAPSPHVGGGEDSSASGSVQAEPGLPLANHDASPWRPIATAPRDRPVLILVEGVVHEASYNGPSDGAIYSGRPSAYNWFSHSEGRTLHDEYATHWMPRPADPTPTSQEAGHE